MFSNSKLRLLMMLVRFERLGEDVPGATWVVPSALTSKDLRETKQIVDTGLVSPMTEFKGQDPRQLLRQGDNGGTRENNHQSTLDIDFGSDSEGEEVPDGPLFPANPRTKSKALDDLKKKRKKGRKEGEPLDEATLEERRRERLANNLARQKKIKSDLYIHQSDEETDDEADKEFFALEEQRRKEQAQRIKEALSIGGRKDAASKKGKGKERKRKSDTQKAPAASANKRQRGGRRAAKDDDDGDPDDVSMAEVDALLSPSPQPEASNGNESGNAESPPPAPIEEMSDMELDDDLAFTRDRQDNSIASALAADAKSNGADAPVERQSEDEDAPETAPSQRRMKAGFVFESDSE